MAIAPPSPLEEFVAEPRAGHTWVPGYWDWVNGRHLWRVGRWIPERRGYHWQRYRWIFRAGRWYLEAGGWTRDEEAPA